MTGQSLKLGKFMTSQVANTFSLVRWLSIILTPDTEDSHLEMYEKLITKKSGKPEQTNAVREF